jgi:uncharacterized membrane protein YcaP (DUF421 family)
MTSGDLATLPRQQCIGALGDVRYAILEPRGQLSVIRRTDDTDPVPDLVRQVLEPPSSSW